MSAGEAPARSKDSPRPAPQRLHPLHTPREMIHLHQMEVVPGRPEQNLRRILDGIRRSTEAGADLAVFPEMAVTGYLLGDEWENDAFLREQHDLHQEIVGFTKDRCAAVWGGVQPVFGPHPPVLGRIPANGYRGEDGRTRKYNAAFVAAEGHPVSNGVFTGFTPKALLPKYRQFDDERHFFSLLKLAQEIGVAPSELLAPFHLKLGSKSRQLGVLLCEDIWDDDYAFKPVDVLRAQQVDLFLNLSASPFGIGKQAKRDRILQAKSQGCEFHYVNAVGAQDNGKNLFVFDGASPVYRNGIKLAQGPNFQDTIVTADSGIANDPDEMEVILRALLEGLRVLFQRTGAGKVVVGISGGIDSAVVATLCVQVLGRENVVGVNMPSRFNSETTRNLARELSDNLGIQYLLAPIEEAVNLTRKQISALTESTVAGLVDENIQARDRSSRVLAGIAAQLGAIHRVQVVFTNNGNKTEVAQGYCTLYGDVDGVIAPIADLYKTQVRALARHLNVRLGNLIPDGILRIKPSAELSETQNPEHGGGDPFQFEYHDRLLYQMIELRRDPEDLLSEALAGRLEQALQIPNERSLIGPTGYFATMSDFIADLETVWRRLKGSFFKRIQAPPIITVSKRAFGFDLREFQGSAHFTRRFTQLKEQALHPSAASSSVSQG